MIPTYGGESAWYQDIGSFTVPTHPCTSSGRCPEIVSALNSTLENALETNKHPYDGDVAAWVFPATLTEVLSRGEVQERPVDAFWDMPPIQANTLDLRAARLVTPPPKKMPHLGGTYKASFDVMVKRKPFGIVWTKTFQTSGHECANPEQCPEVEKKLEEVRELQKKEVLLKNRHLNCMDCDVWVISQGYPTRVS
jgi:hypothetical protein